MFTKLSPYVRTRANVLLAVTSVGLSGSFVHNTKRALKLSSLLGVVFSLSFQAAVLWGQNIHYQADNIVLKPKLDQAILTGRAFIRKKQQGLKADKIIMNNRTQLAEAYGNVTFLNKAQGIFYKGDRLRYDMAKEIIYAEGNPAIDNQIEQVYIEADTFIGYMQRNLITTSGNTRITITHKSDGLTRITGETSIYNTGAQTLEVETNVEINELGQDDKPIEDNYVITCNRSYYVISNNNMECFENVKAENIESESILISDYLFLEKLLNKGTAKGHARFEQASDKKTLVTLADEMVLYKDEERTTLHDDVMIFETNAAGETLTSLACDHATNYYGDPSYLNCYENAILSNFIEDSTITADFIHYDFTEETGYAERTPVMLVKSGTNSNYSRISSLRMEIAQKERVIYFKKDIFVYELEADAAMQLLSGERPPGPRSAEDATDIPEWISCKNAMYNYSRPAHHIFECRGDVILNDVLEQAQLFSDRLVHRFDNGQSVISGNVNFISEKNAPTKIIRGTAKQITRDNHNRQLFFQDNVIVKEFNTNEQAVSILTGEQFIYHYSNERYFEGFKHTRIKKPFRNSILKGNHVLYYIAEERSIVYKQPLFVNITERHTKMLAYAQEMEVLLSQSHTKLHKDVRIIEVAYGEPENEIFNLQSFKRQDYNYLTCEEGTYYFTKQTASGNSSRFECYTNVVITMPRDNLKSFSQYVLHDFANDRSILKDKPRLEITTTDVIRHIRSKTMILENKLSQSFFESNVRMEEFTHSGTLTSKLSCVHGRYNFNIPDNETFHCKENVKVIDLRDHTEIIGDVLEHRLADAYTIITGSPIFTWKQETNLTKVKAEVMEKFDNENIMYAKGNVHVNNGTNEAFSTLGIYKPDTKTITLLGSPQIRDLNTGDEFISDQVSFDLENNEMVLESEVTGSILLEK